MIKETMEPGEMPRPDFRLTRGEKIRRNPWLRILFIIAVSTLFFRYVCRPAFINGRSMLPTYPEKGFLFFLNRPLLPGHLQRGDVVILRYAGEKYMLLKRILAFEDEVIEFKEGDCYINGEKLEEPYLRLKSKTWNLPPRIVEKGTIYVMGDNRDMPLEEHIGGQISINRVEGKPLW